MIKVSELYPLIIEAINDNKTFTMPIHGTSMQPMLHTGDTVDLGYIDNISKNDIVFYKRDDGSFVLHRVYRVNLDNTYDMLGDHQTTIEHNVKRDQIFSKVYAYKRKNKKRLLKGFKYKLYLFTLKSFFIRRVYIRCLH